LPWKVPPRRSTWSPPYVAPSSRRRRGGDPAIPYVGGIPIGDGVAEADYIGALIGQPLKVVKAELSNLLVPASAEIVLFLLDDDFEPANEADPMWALATRVHPVDRTVRFEDGPVLPLLTCYTKDERHAARATKVVYEALLPAQAERESLSDFAHAYPSAVRAKVPARHQH
jgi:3-polyprenyl-4-hydroxybenzoate decarboxylase